MQLGDEQGSMTEIDGLNFLKRVINIIIGNTRFFYIPVEEEMGRGREQTIYDSLLVEPNHH